MSAFEYTASIYSVVLALSAANTLSALADTLKHARTIRHYWVHTAWCLSFLLMHLALWRSIWFNTVGRDSMELFDMLPFFPWVVVWYVGSRLLAPDRDSAGTLDLEAYFFSIKRAFLACLMLPYLGATGWMIATGFMVDVTALIWSTIVVQVALTGAGFVSDNRKLHGAVVIGFVLATVAQEMLQGAIETRL